jgi:putative transposase
VKVSDRGGLSGYDGGKKIKGRKRHILTDTLGNLLEVVISAANLNDRQGAKMLMTKLERQMARRILKIWVDRGYRGYRGDLSTWFYQQWQTALEVVEADPDQKGFAVQPRRWVVERTFAWFGKFRRLSKDYETDPISSEGFIYLASIRLLLKRLV